jgi:cytochrome c-type biogenesis protein CcsB
VTAFAVQAALHWAGVACYLVAAVAFANAVVFANPRRLRWGRLAAACGLVPHAAALALRWAEVGHGPYITRYEVLSSNAWIAVAFLLVFLLRRPSWGALGLVVLPIAILSVASGLSSSGHIRELPPSLRSTWLVFHITFAKLSAAAFLLSLASAVLLLLDHRGVRRARWLEGLPPRDALDVYTVRFVGFGLIFWTVTIAAGAIWAHQSWGRYWGWDAIETWSLVSWLAYGTFLHARLFFRMRPIPTAWAAVGAFAVFILTLLILPALLPSLHSAYFQ